MDVEVRSIEIKQDPKTIGQEEEQDPVQFKLRATKTQSKLAIATLVLAVIQIAIAGVHVYLDRILLAKLWLGFGCAYFVGSIIALLWAKSAHKTLEAKAELFQPSVNEGYTRFLFIVSLILSASALALVANTAVQYDYRYDYSNAYATHPDSNVWTYRYGSKFTSDNVNLFLQASFIAHLFVLAWFAIFWLWTARTQFITLKWDNQAISTLIYVSCIAFVVAGLALSYVARHAYGYRDYQVIPDIFPSWNIKTLFALGIVSAAIGSLGFFVAHRSWRIGYLVLTFLILFGVILIGNFTGYAFNHSKLIYNYYKGTDTITDCSTRLKIVDWRDLDHYGCPQKYLPTDKCSSNDFKTTTWENATEPAPKTSDSTGGAQLLTLNSRDDFMSGLMNAATSACVNTGCCGLQGQLYAHDFLIVANAGLAVILTGVIVLIGCGYFWYVNWIDTARSKQVDYVWLVLFIIALVGSIVVLALQPIPLRFINENLTATGKHQ